jgi:hypothetical protein
MYWGGRLPLRAVPKPKLAMMASARGKPCSVPGSQWTLVTPFVPSSTSRHAAAVMLAGLPQMRTVQRLSRVQRALTPPSKGGAAA